MTNPFSGSNPFEFLLGDLLKMLGSQPGTHTEMARQMAVSIAGDQEDQGNLDPLDRIKYEELSRIIDIHLRDFAALPEMSQTSLRVEIVTRTGWASKTVSDWEKYERMFHDLSALGDGSGTQSSETPVIENPSESFAQMMSKLTKLMAPSMIAMQLGSMVGHLAKVAFGSYEIPVPRPVSSTPMIIAANVDSFASDWGLPLEQVRLWATLREVVMHSIIGSPVITNRLEKLIEQHIRSSNAGLQQIQDRLSQIDPTNLEALQSALSDPSGLFGDGGQTGFQRDIIGNIATAMAVIEGISSNAMGNIGSKILGNSAAIEEAFTRRRIERTDGERLSEQFFGIEITRSWLDRGRDFVRGVIERAGEEGIAFIWEKEGAFPTEAEFEAPGLWLARIELGA